jgi:hypothetical protein
LYLQKLLKPGSLELILLVYLSKVWEPLIFKLIGIQYFGKMESLLKKSEKIPDLQTIKWMAAIYLTRSVSRHIFKPFRGSSIWVKEFKVKKENKILEA